MYKILTVVCVLAIAALGTSVITTVIQRSDVSLQSARITSLSNEQAAERQELAAIQAELRTQPKKKVAAHKVVIETAARAIVGREGDLPVSFVACSFSRRTGPGNIACRS
jgi:Tfp pilus assembly protein PilN